MRAGAIVMRAVCGIGIARSICITQNGGVEIANWAARGRCGRYASAINGICGGRASLDWGGYPYHIDAVGGEFGAVEIAVEVEDAVAAGTQ